MEHGFTFTSFITPTPEPAKEEKFIEMGGKTNHLGCLLPNGKVLCLPNGGEFFLRPSVVPGKLFTFDR